MERWKPVLGYEGLYSASDMGRVRSEERTINREEGWDGRKGGRVHYPERILSTKRKDSARHELCGLQKDKKKTVYDVHRLVYEAHVRPLEKGEVVHHKNDAKWDNRLDNLIAMGDAEHKSHHQQAINQKCELADFLTLCWIIKGAT